MTRNKTLKEIKVLGSTMIGFAVGVWLYDVYKEGGWELMATEGWKGLGVALLIWGALMVSDRVWVWAQTFLRKKAP
ncbi:MAG: hypothetical protein NZ585_06540 [Chloracidobacterium sp.]|nr:hypothetical protein [Chloracidobacterium sp.]MDW8218344.1 hypothetical protein [Acidobacteriota bacterium]